MAVTDEVVIRRLRAFKGAGTNLSRTAANRIERLRSALESLRRSHISCDDCWYSCPKSEDGCCNDSIPKDECTCGADAHNARINAALSQQHHVEQK